MESSSCRPITTHVMDFSGSIQVVFRRYWLETWLILGIYAWILFRTIYARSSSNPCVCVGRSSCISCVLSLRRYFFTQREWYQFSICALTGQKTAVIFAVKTSASNSVPSDPWASLLVPITMWISSFKFLSQMSVRAFLSGTQLSRKVPDKAF